MVKVSLFFEIQDSSSTPSDSACEKLDDGITPGVADRNSPSHCFRPLPIKQATKVCTLFGEIRKTIGAAIDLPCFERNCMTSVFCYSFSSICRSVAGILSSSVEIFFLLTASDVSRFFCRNVITFASFPFFSSISFTISFLSFLMYCPAAILTKKVRVQAKYVDGFRSAPRCLSSVVLMD